MPKENYTEEEKRTLAAMETWNNACNTHDDVDKMVNEIYADNCEIFAPFQRVYFMKIGQRKENWKNWETENAKIWLKRTQKIVSCIVQGNRVAMECEVEMQRFGGKVVKGMYAAFLTFDKDGRVTCDHTYVDTPPFKRLVNKPELDMVPELKKAMQKILDSQ